MMRFRKGLLVGLVAASLVGCSNSASRPTPAGSSVFEAPTSGASTIPSAAAPVSTKHATAQAGSVEPETQVGARAAAMQFYGLYSASQFAASWDLLVPGAKRQVPQSVWVGVHDGCPSIGAGKARIIKIVTVFGNAAIITEEIAGVLSRLGAAEDVFNYANGHWGYSPGELGVYHHGSVAADVAAARAAGFCGSKKTSLL